MLLGSLALLGVGVYVVIAKGWAPRYLVFTTVPVLVLAASFIVEIAQKVATWLVAKRDVLLEPSRCGLTLSFLLMVSASWLVTDYVLLSDPIQAELPREDRILFVEGWTAGYGIREAVTFLRDEARQRGEPVTAIKHCCYIASLDGLAVYLTGQRDVQLVTLNLYLPDDIARLQQFAVRQTFYYVSNEPQEPSQAVSPAKFGIESKLVWVYHKPGQRSRIEIYVVNPLNPVDNSR